MIQATEPMRVKLKISYADFSFTLILYRAKKTTTTVVCGGNEGCYLLFGRSKYEKPIRDNWHEDMLTSSLKIKMNSYFVFHKKTMRNYS